VHVMEHVGLTRRRRRRRGSRSRAIFIFIAVAVALLAASGLCDVDNVVLLLIIDSLIGSNTTRCLLNYSKNNQHLPTTNPQNQ
jgi:hypothetical protein